MDLPSIIDQLEKIHGRPKPPRLQGPFELILWENVVYLASDEKRRPALNALRDEVGLTPAEILSTPTNALLMVTRLAGILPETQVTKIQRIAQIAQDEFGGDLDQILRQPLKLAMRSLKKFPGIGDPGAEKILLFCRAHPLFALESNGLRVLLRLGFGQEQKNYAASYRSVQAAVKEQIKADCDWLIRAHHLLRLHGQEVCRRSRPDCEVCPLTKVCHYYQASL